MLSRDQIALIGLLEEAGRQYGVEVYAVGGMVRDLLRNDFHDRDLDFVVEGNAIEFASNISRLLGGTSREFGRFGTAKVIELPAELDYTEVDFATARTERYTCPGALPEVSASSIESDLARRDFTINAMALPVAALCDWTAIEAPSAEDLRSQVLDQFDGLKDLDQRCIRWLHPQSFVDDPTRMFRACRYSARINGALSSDTEQGLHTALDADVLSTISIYRMRREWEHVFNEANPAAVLERAAALKLLQAAMGTKESHYAEEVLHLAAAVFQSLALSSKCFSADFFSMLGALILLTPLDQTARQNFLTHAQYKKSERHWLEIELQKVIQARDELTLPGEGSLASLLLLNGFIPRGEKMEQFQDDVRSELAKCL